MTRATWHETHDDTQFTYSCNYEWHKYISMTQMHEYYINKYIPSRYLVRYQIRVAHEVYSYFIKQSGYKSLIFLAYLVLSPSYDQV